jgi:hypothetical protein
MKNAGVTWVKKRNHPRRQPLPMALDAAPVLTLGSARDALPILSQLQPFAPNRTSGELSVC